MDVLLATSNPGKIEELRELLALVEAPGFLMGLAEFTPTSDAAAGAAGASGFSVTLRTLPEFPDIPDCPEDEPTFEQNAVVKARYYAERTGLPTIADDGGLEIDALGGWPGVHSRRIFGDGQRATDEELISEVLRRMRGIPTVQRGCQMRTVVAFAAPGGTVFHAEGADRGVIADQPSNRRVPGFPFRSLFFHNTAGAIVTDVFTGDPMTMPFSLSCRSSRVGYSPREWNRRYTNETPVQPPSRSTRCSIRWNGNL